MNVKKQGVGILSRIVWTILFADITVNGISLSTPMEAAYYQLVKHFRRDMNSINIKLLLIESRKLAEC